MADRFMRAAIDEARDGIRHGEGGPFGAVIVKDGKIVGRGHNRVLLKKDPTCHGETEAIRSACAELDTYDLNGCEIYTTAEPCPMCLGAIMWANIGKVYYGCGRLDTEKIGFRDNKFYDFLDGRGDVLDISELDRDECMNVFDEYSANDDKKIY